MIPYRFDSTFSKCKLSVFKENCSPCMCGRKNCLKTEHIYPHDVATSWSKSILGSVLCVLPLGPLTHYLVSAQWYTDSL